MSESERMSPEVVQRLKKFNEAITAVEDALQKNFSLDPEQRREVRIFLRRNGHECSSWNSLVLVILMRSADCFHFQRFHYSCKVKFNCSHVKNFQMSVSDKAQFDLMSVFAINSFYWMIQCTRGKNPRKNESLQNEIVCFTIIRFSRICMHCNASSKAYNKFAETVTKRVKF